MLDDIAVSVEKDYSHNKEALKVDYLVGLPSLTSRGEQVPEHGHDACTHQLPEPEPLSWPGSVTAGTHFPPHSNYCF